jgi:hypothetical protein
VILPNIRQDGIDWHAAGVVDIVPWLRPDRPGLRLRSAERTGKPWGKKSVRLV